MLLMDKMDVNIDCPAWFGLRSRILGEKGANLDFIKSETDVAVILKGAEKSKATPLHFSFICDEQYPEKLKKAKKLALDLICTIREDLKASTATASPDINWEINKIPSEPGTKTKIGAPPTSLKSNETIKGKKQQQAIPTKETLPIWNETLQNKPKNEYVKNTSNFQKAQISAKNPTPVFPSKNSSQKKSQIYPQHQPSATILQSQEIPILKPPPVLSAMISQSQNQNFTEQLQPPLSFSTNISSQIPNKDDFLKAQISNTQSQFIPAPPPPVISMLPAPQLVGQNETTQLVKLDPSQQILVAPDGTQYLQVKVQSNDTNTQNYYPTPNPVAPIMVDPMQIMNSMMGISPMMDFGTAQQALVPGNIVQVNSQTTMVRSQQDKTIASQVSTNLLAGMDIPKQTSASAVPPILPLPQKVTEIKGVRPVFAARVPGPSVPWFGAGAVPAPVPLPVPVPVPTPVAVPTSTAVPAPTPVPAPAPLPVPAADALPHGVLAAAKSRSGAASADGALKQKTLSKAVPRASTGNVQAARSTIIGSLDISPEQWDRKLADMRAQQRELLEEAKKTGNFAAFEKSVRNYNEIVKYMKEGESRRAAGGGREGDGTDYTQLAMDESSGGEAEPGARDARAKRSSHRGSSKRKRSRTYSSSSSSGKSEKSYGKDLKKKSKDSKRNTKSPGKGQDRHGRKKIEILFERDLPKREIPFLANKSKSRFHRPSPRKSPKREHERKEKRSLTPEVVVVKKVDSAQKIDTKVPFYASQSSKPVASQTLVPENRTSDPVVKTTNKSSADNFSTKNNSKNQSEFPYTSWANTEVTKYPVNPKTVTDFVLNKTNIKEAHPAKKLLDSNHKSIGNDNINFKTKEINSDKNVEHYSPTRAPENYNVQTKDWNILTAKLRRNIDAIKTQNLDRNNTFDIVSRDSGRESAGISQTCVSDALKDNFNIKPAQTFPENSIQSSDQFSEKKTPWIDAGKDHFGIKSADGFADRKRDDENLYGMKKDPWMNADKDFFSIKPSQIPYESPKVSAHSQNNLPKKDSDNFNIMSNSYRVPDSNYKKEQPQSDLSSSSEWINPSQNKGNISDKKPEPKWEIPSRHESETCERNPRSESEPNWEINARPENRPNWESRARSKEKLDWGSQPKLDKESDWETIPRAERDSNSLPQPKFERRSDMQSQPRAEGMPNWGTHSKSDERDGSATHPKSAVTSDWKSQPGLKGELDWKPQHGSKDKPNWEMHPESKGKPIWETHPKTEDKVHEETYPISEGRTDLGTHPLSGGIGNWQAQPKIGTKPDWDAHPKSMGRPDWEPHPLSERRPDWETKAMPARRPDWEMQSMSARRPDWEKQPMSAKRPDWEKQPMSAGRPDWEKQPLAARRADWEIQPMSARRHDWEPQPMSARRPDWEKQPMSTGRHDWETQPLSAIRPDWETQPISARRPDWETQPMSAKRSHLETHPTDVGSPKWETPPLRGYTDSVWLPKNNKSLSSREEPDNNDFRRRNLDDNWRVGGRGGWY